MKALRLAVCAVLSIVALHAPSFGASKEECARTAGMKIYSNAFIHEETGDLLGFELAIAQDSDSTVVALLYVYEGADSDGIPISGRITEKRLTIEGNWVEHVVEYPSKKEIVQKHLVKIDGKLNFGSFTGKTEVEGLVASGAVRLKRVNHIWVCRR